MPSRVALVLALCIVGSCTCGEGALVGHGGAGAGGGGGGAGGSGSCVDADHDGYCADKDCDDSDPSRHPGATETCDGVDQDCNGVTDDQLFDCKTCGDCGPGAVLPGGFDPGPGTSVGVTTDPDGYLVLTGEIADLSFAWIANSGEGTVSKIDTRTGREVARYPSSRHYNNIACERTATNRGDCPSRTAIDGNGDVWVANRAFGGLGSVTKIANLGCPDRNGDGKVTTSADLNKNGIIDMGTDEFPGDADECVLFTVDAGGAGGIPRALALDGGTIENDVGSVWVGLNGKGQALKLRNDTGAVLATIDLPVVPGSPPDKLHPYGAAIDRQQRVWFSNDPGYPAALGYVDAGTGDIAGPFLPPAAMVPAGGGDPLACNTFYGIAVDEKDRVWLGGYGCAAAYRYDPADGSWAVATVPGVSPARGIAVERREGMSSRVWVAFSVKVGDSRLAAFDAETLQTLGNWELTGTQGVIGVGLDDAGKIWAVNELTSNAAWFDPTTGKSVIVPVGKLPYTYSDFTGYARRNFTAPQGTWRHDFNACDGKPATFLSVAWDGETPPGTRIDVSVQIADSQVALPSAPKMGPFSQTPDANSSPGDLKGTKGNLARVEAVLRSTTRDATPKLHDLHLLWTCPGPG